MRLSRVCLALGVLAVACAFAAFALPPPEYGAAATPAEVATLAVAVQPEFGLIAALIVFVLVVAPMRARAWFERRRRSSERAPADRRGTLMIVGGTEFAAPA